MNEYVLTLFCSEMLISVKIEINISRQPSFKEKANITCRQFFYSFDLTMDSNIELRFAVRTFDHLNAFR